jgi:hypothetical protein
MACGATVGGALQPPVPSGAAQLSNKSQRRARGRTRAAEKLEVPPEVATTNRARATIAAVWGCMNYQIHFVGPDGETIDVFALLASRGMRFRTFTSMCFAAEIIVL